MIRRIVLIIACLLFCNGCVVAIAKGIQRGVVHDDVVYVKENNTLYRRYIPHGMLLKGNQEVLDLVGPITNRNDKIEVYSNYQEAVKNCSGFVIDPESEKYFK